MPRQCCKDKFSQIPDEEGVFILRAKDKLAIETVRFWIGLAIKSRVNPEKLQKVRDHLQDMIDFEVKFPERMKIPD